jgi:hypothetical protein
MRRTALLALLAGLALAAGCIGGSDDLEAAESNDTDDPPEAAEPVLPTEIGGLTEIASLETDGGGNGVWIDEERDLLLSTNAGAGLQIVDVADPDNPELLGTLGEVTARDVDLLRVDGTPYAVLADSAEGIHVVDVADPTAPELVATADEYASHNLAAVPGTPYVYDSTAQTQAKATGEPIVPVLDLSSPADPEWTTVEIPATVNGQPVQSDGCHDVVVRVDLGQAFCAGGGGFYAAGGGETFVWNISEDPTDPEWVGVVDNPSIVYHHQAVASEDGDLLFINDEHLAPNCNGVSTPAGDARQTTAAMWVYDISDPGSPELMDYVQVDDEDANANCGSHFGDLVDGRDLLVWGWYQGGTLLIDVSDPQDATITDRIEPIGSTWDARYHEGHVYASSGDLQVLGFRPA